MDSDADFDLEELESRLYSQVHHSSKKENVPVLNLQPLSKANLCQTNHFSPNMHKNRYYAEKSDHSEPSNINIHVNFDGFRQISPATNTNVRFNFNQNDSLPPTNENNPVFNKGQEKPDSSVPQYMPLTYPPIANNIFVIPQRSAVRKESRYQGVNKWKQRREEREKVLKAASENAELFRMLSVEDRKKVRKYERRQRQLENRKNRKKNENERNIINKYNMQQQVTTSTPTVINPPTTSDNVSDPNIALNKHFKDSAKKDNDGKTLDDISIVNDEHELLVISSDDDDVMVIEQDESQSAEIISLESEPINKSLDDSQLMKPPSDPENKGKPSNYLSTKERNELLSTPESTNDFLDNSVVLPRETLGETSKPRAISEIESESSCSASDISTPIKSNMFNEPEFETPKELFSESNLEKFSEFITPKRKAVSTTLVQEETIGGSSKTSDLNNESFENESNSSSSESDYESASNLPNLSYFEDNQDQDSLTPAKKRKSSSKSKEEKKSKRKKKNKSFEERLDDLVNKLIQSKDKDKDEANDLKTNNETKKIKKKRKSKVEVDKWQVEEDKNSKLSKNFVIVDKCGEDFDIESDKSSEHIQVENNESSDEDNLSDMENIGNDMNLANIKMVQLPKQTKGNEKKRFIDTWSDNMEVWYNNNLNDKYLDVQEIQRSMSDDPNKWKILDCDKFFISQSTPRGPRCKRCNRPGHRASYCSEKPGPPKCCLCGELGHLEPRCPNKMCTGCGKKSSFSTTYCSKCAPIQKEVCSLCKMTGHSNNRCPDLWRRYHLTTEEGPIVELGNKKTKHASDLKPHHKRWCSGCAKKGHLEYKCKYYNRTHPPVVPYIIKYEELYGFAKNRKKKFSENDESFDTMKLPPENKNETQEDNNKVEDNEKVKDASMDQVKRKTNTTQKENEEVVERVKRKREKTIDDKEAFDETSPKKVRTYSNNDESQDLITTKKKKKKSKNEEVLEEDEIEEYSKNKKKKQSKADNIEEATKSPKSKNNKKKKTKVIFNKDSGGEDTENLTANFTHSDKKKKLKSKAEDSETINESIDKLGKKSSKKKNKTIQFIETDDSQENKNVDHNNDRNEGKSGKKKKSQIRNEDEIHVESRNNEVSDSYDKNPDLLEPQHSLEISNFSGSIEREKNQDCVENEEAQLTVNPDFGTLRVFMDNECSNDSKDDYKPIKNENLNEHLLISNDSNKLQEENLNSNEENQKDHSSLEIKAEKIVPEESKLKSIKDKVLYDQNNTQIDSNQKTDNLMESTSKATNVDSTPNTKNMKSQESNIPFEESNELSSIVKKEIISKEIICNIKVEQKIPQETNAKSPNLISNLENNTNDCQPIDKHKDIDNSMINNPEIPSYNIKLEAANNEFESHQAPGSVSIISSEDPPLTTIKTEILSNLEKTVSTKESNLKETSEHKNNSLNSEIPIKEEIILNVTTEVENELTVFDNTTMQTTENQINIQENNTNLANEGCTNQVQMTNLPQVQLGNNRENVSTILTVNPCVDLSFSSQSHDLLKELEESLEYYKLYISFDLNSSRQVQSRRGKNFLNHSKVNFNYDLFSFYVEGKGCYVVKKVREILIYLKTSNVSIHFHPLIAKIQYHFRIIKKTEYSKYLKYYKAWLTTKSNACREKLNIILLVYCGLAEGPSHLENLKNILIKNDKPKCYFSSFTADCVQSSIDYIFKSKFSYNFYKKSVLDLQCKKIKINKNILNEVFNRKLEWNIRKNTNEPALTEGTNCAVDVEDAIENLNQTLEPENVGILFNSPLEQSSCAPNTSFNNLPLNNFTLIMEYLKANKHVFKIYISLSCDDYEKFVNKKYNGHNILKGMKGKVDELYFLIELEDFGNKLYGKLGHIKTFLKTPYLFLNFDHTLAKVVYTLRKIYHFEFDSPVMLFADYLYKNQYATQIKLNTCLFGYYGLEDGVKHLTKLKEVLKIYSNHKTFTLESSVKDDIEQSLGYIFYECRTSSKYFELIEYIHDNNLKPLQTLNDLFLEDVVKRNESTSDLIDTIKYNISLEQSKKVFESPIMTELLTELEQNMFYELKILPEFADRYITLILTGMIKYITTGFIKFMKILNSTDRIDNYSKPTEIFTFLEETLTNLNILYYITDCNKLYEEIVNLEQSPNFYLSRELGEHFKKLNSILFGKYELHDGKRHMATLIYFKEKLKFAVEGDIMTASSFLEIRNAYKFIFDSTRKTNVDYLLALQVIDSGEKHDILNDIDYSFKNKVEMQIEHYKNVCTENRQETKLKELKVFETYLTNTTFTAEVYNSAIRFLKDIEKYLLECKHL